MGRNGEALVHLVKPELRPFRMERCGICGTSSQDTCLQANRRDDAIVAYRAAQATAPTAQSARVALMNALLGRGDRAGQRGWPSRFRPSNRTSSIHGGCTGGAVPFVSTGDVASPGAWPMTVRPVNRGAGRDVAAGARGRRRESCRAARDAAAAGVPGRRQRRGRGCLRSGSLGKAHGEPAGGRLSSDGQRRAAGRRQRELRQAADRRDGRPRRELQRHRYGAGTAAARRRTAHARPGPPGSAEADPCSTCA